MAETNVQVPVFGDDFKTIKTHLAPGTHMPMVRIDGKKYWLHMVSVGDELAARPHFTPSMSKHAEVNALAKYYIRAGGRSFLPNFPVTALNRRLEEFDINKHINVFNAYSDWVGFIEYDPDEEQSDTIFIGTGKYNFKPSETAVGRFVFEHFLSENADQNRDLRWPGAIRDIINPPKKKAINMISREDLELFRQEIGEANALDNYQRIASATAVYPGKSGPQGLIYCALKLNGESGELAEHVGKAMRDDGYAQIDEHGEQYEIITPERARLIDKEIGDVLWYVAALARERGKTLSQVALENLEKLADRADRNALQGSGDER